MLEGIFDRLKGTEQGESEMESCAICHRQLDVPKDMPVERRRNYYEGVGQICDGCREMIYGGGS